MPDSAAAGDSHDGTFSLLIPPPTPEHAAEQARHVQEADTRYLREAENVFGLGYRVRGMLRVRCCASLCALLVLLLIRIVAHRGVGTAIAPFLASTGMPQ